MTTGFGVSFAAATEEDGKISLLNQEISGVLTAVGGGMVGAVISILVTRASNQETLQRMTHVLEHSLTSSLRSDNARLTPVRHLWHHYFITTVRGKNVWRYEQYPFDLSANVGSLAVEIDVESDMGLVNKYLVEAFVRHERLTIVSHKARDESNVFVEVYPQFGGELSEYFGIGFVRTWDSTNIVTKVVLSRLPLVPGSIGTLSDSDCAEMERIWELGFGRQNEVLPNCT
ncbi:hypothetical protein [Streptomyces iakyrus]